MFLKTCTSSSGAPFRIPWSILIAILVVASAWADPNRHRTAARMRRGMGFSDDGCVNETSASHRRSILALCQIVQASRSGGNMFTGRTYGRHGHDIDTEF